MTCALALRRPRCAARGGGRPGAGDRGGAAPWFDTTGRTRPGPPCAWCATRSPTRLRRGCGPPVARAAAPSRDGPAWARARRRGARVARLQALLDHVERGHTRVAGDRGKHAGGRDRKRVVALTAAAQRLFRSFVRGKVQRVRRPGRRERCERRVRQAGRGGIRPAARAYPAPRETAQTPPYSPRTPSRLTTALRACDTVEPCSCGQHTPLSRTLRDVSRACEPTAGAPAGLGGPRPASASLWCRRGTSRRALLCRQQRLRPCAAPQDRVRRAAGSACTCTCRRGAPGAPHPQEGQAVRGLRVAACGCGGLCVGALRHTVPPSLHRSARLACLYGARWAAASAVCRDRARARAVAVYHVRAADITGRTALAAGGLLGGQQAS